MENDYEKLLNEWNLKEYISNFKDEGYIEVKDWKNLTVKQLENDFKMKTDDAKKFIRLMKAYFIKEPFMN